MTVKPNLKPSLPFQSLILSAIAIIVCINFVAWGGVPRGEAVPVFWIGVGLLILICAGFGWLTWHLLFRQLPAGHRLPAATSAPASIRLLIATLLGIASLYLVVGGFWDEVWHRQYGLPFGDDFFWRPHIMMYFCFGAVMLLGMYSLYQLMRAGQGTFQQRFRANPILGLVVLVAAFLFFALPADPIWHSIYGEDLSAWSIPHLLLFFAFASVMLLAVALQLSTIPVQNWRGVWRLGLSDLIPLLMIASIVLTMGQLMLTEWDNMTRLTPLMQSRPEWLLPAIIVGLVAGVGTLINHALRCVGAATVSVLLALGTRLLLIRLFETNIMSADGWLLMIAPALLLDLWYAFRLRQSDRRLLWLGGALAAALGTLVISYPLAESLYPVFQVQNMPLMVIIIVLTSIGTSWLGTQIGDYLATANKFVESAPITVPVRAVSIGGLLASMALIVVLVVTATPPI